MDTRKFKLTVSDRLSLLQVLPARGSYVQLQVAKRLSECLNLSLKEIDYLELKSVPSGAGTAVRWNPKKDKGVEIELSKLETDEIAARLKELDEKKELTREQVRLYEMFCVGSG